MQLSLILDAPGARRAGAETSKMAAAQAKELQAAHCDAILTCLRKHGAMSKTGIASRTHLDSTQVCRRLPEMKRAGLVLPTGRKLPSASGRAEREWRLA